MKPLIGLSIILATVVVISSCEKDPVIPNEEELITYFELLLQSSGHEARFIFEDPDGDGGIAPVIMPDTLLSDQTYHGVIIMRNASVNPWTDISAEVAEEGVDHQFFYLPQGIDLAIEYSDQDDNGRPVGLQIALTAGDPGEGGMQIILRHLPDKLAEGVSGGNVHNAGGETDIEITFPVIIQ